MKASILVVDDQAAIVLATKKRLMDQGFDVDTASNGEEALTKIEQKNYDIVLLDVNMPIMNGIQVLEFITAKHPFSDVMMMTAFDDYSLASECMKKGAKDYLLKPIDYTELISRINSLLRVRDSEHRFTDLRNFWQSTVLFDIFGSIQSIQFILNHTIESMKSVVPEKDLALLTHARNLNDRITQTLKNSTSVNDLAVCDRWNRCANCALKDHTQETDVAEGVFLHGESAVDLGALIRNVADRYEPCFKGKEIVFQLSVEAQLPQVKCDPDRIEQVMNSVFENGVGTSGRGDTITMGLSKSHVGLRGEPSPCVICTIKYSNRTRVLDGMTAEATEWKNIDNALTPTAMNLTISRRILEAQRGAFQIGTSEENHIQIKFSLPQA